MEPDIELDTLAHLVIGAALEVHRELGPGYLESVYQNALSIELRSTGVKFEAQKPFLLNYKQQHIGEGRLDFLVGDRLVVEIKAVESLLRSEERRVGKECRSRWSAYHSKKKQVMGVLELDAELVAAWLYVQLETVRKGVY